MFFNFFIALQLVVILLLCCSVNCFEPFSTIGAVALATWAAKANYDALKDLTICQMTECCTNAHIPADFDGTYGVYGPKSF